MSTTRRAIRQRLLQECGIGFNRTATGGAATTLIDTVRLQNTAADSSSFRGCWLYMPAALAADAIRRITSSTGSTGTLTHQGANYGVSPASGDVYEVIKLIHPDDLNSAINRAMERLWFETWAPLTLVVDGDMEASGVSNWTDSTATSSKVTTSGYRQDQALSVVNSGANGYTQSASVDVKSGAYGFASSIVSAVAAGTTASIIVWDVTNAVSIVTATMSQIARHVAYVNFTVPSTCEQIALRLGSTGAATTAVFDNAILHVQHANVFNMPSWITRKQQVLSIRHQLVQGSPVTLSGSSTFYPEDAMSWPVVKVLDYESDPTGTVALRVVLDDYAGPWPLWVQATRQFGTFTADTSTGGTTDAPEDLAVSACKVELYQALNGQYKGKFDKELKDAQRSFAALSRQEAPRSNRGWRSPWA